MHEMIVWTGPVHSGKSTQALIRAERYLRLGHDVQLVRPRVSVRPELGDTPGMLKTKTGHKYPSIEIDTPEEIEEATEGATVVWVDEAMLFGDGDSRVANVIARVRQRAVVLITGLCATSELRIFGEAMPTLMAMADEVRWCKADCDFCNSLGLATRSFCMVPKKADVLVGGENVYKAACPRCWTREMHPDAVSQLGSEAAT